MNHLSVDVAIVGGGLTGLWLAQKFTALGFSAAVVERGKSFVSGPSTRNEGWLHAGTYHSVSISDPAEAAQVAKRCMYGHRQTINLAPEAVEDPDGFAIAFTTSESQVAEVTKRWELAGVEHEELSTQTLRELVPEAESEDIIASYRVRDVAINTRILAAKLLTTARLNRCHFLTGATPVASNSQHDRLIVESDSDQIELVARLFVFAAGYGLPAVVRRLYGIEIPLRYWKSHLMVTERLSRLSLFSLCPGEAAMMNHRDHSITGLNNDATLCDEPSFDTIDSRLQNVREALIHRFPRSRPASHGLACIKVDLPATAGAFRSLNVSVVEILPGHLCVLPGKMTEIPYVVDATVAASFNSLDCNDVSLRPCDDWERLRKEKK